MRLPTLTTLLTLLLLPLTHATTAADDFPPPSTHTHSTPLHLYSLHGTTPTPFATLHYTPRTLHGTLTLHPTYPPEGLLRLGAPSTETTTTTTATALLASGLTVRLDAHGAVWAVSVGGAPPGEVVVTRAVVQGVEPVLNKPVVLNPEGKLPEVVVEKTLLQKYWWVLLAGVVLLVSGGGGEQ